MIVIICRLYLEKCGLDEGQAGIKIARRRINNLRHADYITLRAESEELKSPLLKMKEESEKVGLELNIQKMKITASVPIDSWQIDGKTGNTCRLLSLSLSLSVLLVYKITRDGDCSHEIKRRLLLGRQAMANIENILKSRDITLATRYILSRLWFFQVVMYTCYSWSMKKAEHWRTNGFDLWCWKRLWWVP